MQTFEEIKNKVRQLQDGYPVLLLPVRLEVRFMQIKHVGRVANAAQVANSAQAGTLDAMYQDDLNIVAQQAQALGNATQPLLLPGLPVDKNHPRFAQGLTWQPDKKELWVRIFPDEIAIHTHEQLLTKDELEEGQSFWRELWRAEHLDAAILQDRTPEELTRYRYHHRLGAWRALINSYGTARAAWIAEVTRPTNAGTGVTNFPQAEPVFRTNIQTKDLSWNDQPRSYVMPDAFVVQAWRRDGSTKAAVVGQSIPQPLPVGINPQESDPAAFKESGRGLVMPESIRWLTDFDAAEAVGMGIRIPLTDEEFEQGFTKLTVLGLTTSASASEQQSTVQQLLENHYYTPGGLSLIANGTPSNNTTDSNAAPNLDELEPEESFALIIEGNGFATTEQHDQKTDGQRMAEGLGLPMSFFQRVFGAVGQDFSQSLWANRVLSPATLGYALPQYFSPALSPEDLSKTLDFMNTYVSGRGAFSTLRVDEQPYALLPVTAFAKWRAAHQEGLEPFVEKLYRQVLQKLMVEWDRMAAFSPHLRKGLAGDDVSRNLFTILEQHASSVDFFQRLILDEQALATLMSLTEGTDANPVSNDGKSATVLRQELTNLGFNFDAELIAFSLFFADRYADLTGPILERLPFSETNPLRRMPVSEQNYLQWLGALSTGFYDIKNEAIFNGVDVFPPRGLLYLLTRHALLRSYLLAALELRFGSDSPLVPALSMDFPRNMVWIEDANNLANNELQLHFAAIIRSLVARLPNMNTEAAITAAVNQLIVQNRELFVSNDKWSLLDAALANQLDTQVATGSGNGAVGALRKQKEYLRRLAGLPTAAIERLFAEHLDVCHHRLDAWLLGMTHHRLDDLRRQRPTGIYLGAYGYLENLQRENPGLSIVTVSNTAPSASDERRILPIFEPSGTRLSQAQLQNLLANAFVYLGGDSISEGGGFRGFDYDADANAILPNPRPQAGNQGFIPAPSLAHAITASVLRNGHLSQKQNNLNLPDESFAINLNSMRVREAMYLLEGMRNGQALAALLGYKFERALRESNHLAIQLLYEFREKFPFQVQPLGGVAGELEESQVRTVVNGLDLIDAFKAQGLTLFNDFTINAAQQDDIVAAIEHLDETLDAVKDLLMAESIHQLVLNNPERSRAAMKALNDGGNIHLPDIVKVPREGISLTHRVGVQLSRNGNAKAWFGPNSMRSMVEPRINQWLYSKLPNPVRIVIRARWTDRFEGDDKPVYRFENIKLTQLTIQPIDFVYALHLYKESRVDNDLLYRVDGFLRSKYNLQPWQTVEILERDRTDFAAQEITLFAIEPLALSLAEIITTARPIRPEDVVLPNDPAAADTVALLRPGLLNRRIKSLQAPFTIAVQELEREVPRLEPYTRMTEDELQQNLSNVELRLRLLRGRLLFFANLGWKDSLPAIDRSVNLPNLQVLYLQGLQTLRKATAARDRINAIFNQYETDTTLDNEARLALLEEVNTLAFDKNFKVFPEYVIIRPDDYKKALEHQDLLAFAGDYAMDEWLQSLAPVRPRMANFQQMNILSDLLASTWSQLRLAQFPYNPDGKDRWLGMDYPPDYDEFDANNQRRLPDDNLSLAFEYPLDFDADRPNAGFIIDEWTEQIPLRDTNLGLAMHYNKPNSEPPNALLLAVAPELTGQWEWDDLMDTVIETFEMARRRTVDPDAMKNSNSPLAQFLPAVMPALNLNDHAPSVDLGRNMQEATPGESGLVMKRFDLDGETPAESGGFDVDSLEIDDLLD